MTPAENTTKTKAAQSADRAACKFCDGTGLRVLRGDHATAVVSCLYCTPNPGPGTIIHDKKTA